MNPVRVTRRPTAVRVAAVLALLIVLALMTALAVVAPATQANAAARVSVAGLDGGARAAVDRPTTLKVSGGGFQSISKGFGGIYVLFGWVSDPSGGSWRPSVGGATGDDLRYVPDSEAADNAGYQRFVAFPGSSTASEANGGTIAADGTWATRLVVPGATFSTVDRSGATVDVDCTQVQCGVITIGAHGVKNGANETFTPVSFGAGSSGSDDGAEPSGGSADPDVVPDVVPDVTPDDAATEDPSADGDGSDGAAAGGTTAGATGGAAAGSGGAAAGKAAENAELPGRATVGIDRSTAVAGRVLAFTGQGFEPGEQVLATLDGGVLAVGPLTAGNSGEVAGLLELPSDLRLGTHALKVSGASSGRDPEVELIVTRDPAEAEATDALIASASGADGAAGPAAEGLAYSPAELAAGAALLVLLLVVVSSAVAGARRRRAVRAANTAANTATNTAANTATNTAANTATTADGDRSDA